MLCTELTVAEHVRLEAVHRYDILDTPPDGTFDSITALAARLFGVSIALVTIVDEDRIWFKSRFGLDDVTEIPRDPGLCASAICQDLPYVIADARNDVRTLANPLVAGEFGLQFYAAAPLRTKEGHKLGTLCLIDRLPRTLSQQETETLAMLAGIVVDKMELRLDAIRSVASERQARRSLAQMAEANAAVYQREHRVVEAFQQSVLPRPLPILDRVVVDALYQSAIEEDRIGGDWYDVFHIDDRHLLMSIGDVAGHGLEAAIIMGKLSQSLRALALLEKSPTELLRRLDALLRREDPDAIVTAFVGVLNTNTNILEFANAGHPAPLHRSPEGVVSEMKNGGLPLGLRTDDEPAAGTFHVSAESFLFFYTDGLTEATRDILRGEALLVQTLRNPAMIYAPHPAREVAAAILPDGSAFDDVAILTVRIASNSQSSS